VVLPLPTACCKCLKRKNNEPSFGSEHDKTGCFFVPRIF
jgi:hypothetical protein